jgi:hypothetical protein
VPVLPPRWLALSVVVALAACSGGDDAGEAEPPEPEISEQSVEVPTIELEVTRSEYVSPHQERGPIPAAAQRDAVATLQQLFDATVVDAAVLGEPGDASEVFTADALDRVRTRDYRALVDDAVGPLDGLDAARARVGLAGLAGDDNQPQLIVAVIDWDVRSPDRSVRITRSGELSLVPSGGQWRVAAYNVVTQRTTGGRTTSTTATTEEVDR